MVNVNQTCYDGAKQLVWQGNGAELSFDMRFKGAETSCRFSANRLFQTAGAVMEKECEVR